MRNTESSAGCLRHSWMQALTEIFRMPPFLPFEEAETTARLSGRSWSQGEDAAAARDALKAAREEEKYSGFSLFLSFNGPLVPSLIDPGVWGTQPVRLEAERGKE